MVSAVTLGEVNTSNLGSLVSMVTAGPAVWVQLMPLTVSPLARVGQARREVAVSARTVMKLPAGAALTTTSALALALRPSVKVTSARRRTVPGAAGSKATVALRAACNSTVAPLSCTQLMSARAPLHACTVALAVLPAATVVSARIRATQAPGSTGGVGAPGEDPPPPPQAASREAARPRAARRRPGQVDCELDKLKTIEAFGFTEVLIKVTGCAKLIAPQIAGLR